MQLRKLDVSEHSRTRRLWEEVFPEDSKEFLDYYYFIKTRDNQIYTTELDGDIRSMLQLNPYLLHIGERQHVCNYIVAVATQEQYRRRGFMGELLRKSMKDMYEQREPFTFLMPAAKEIYTPYDFRFIYAQSQATLYGRQGSPLVSLRDAALGDGEAMAKFFHEWVSGDYQVYAHRDDMYYQTMIFEQQSQRGGVKLMEQEGHIVGMFAYACDGHTVEIREPLYLSGFEEDFEKVVGQLRDESKEPIKVLAGGNIGDREDKPLIMARILHLETLLKAVQVKAGQSICCSFAVLDSILTKNSKVIRLQGEEGSKLCVEEAEDSEGVLTIGALTGILFGSMSIEEADMDENVVMSKRLCRELEKLQSLQQVFLNEIV